MFLLNSCTEEREYLKNNRELNVEEKPFKELLLLKDFNTAYQKVKTEKQKSIISRSALEDEYNFTIVEDKDVKIMNVDGKTFYNILIQRDSVAANFFENLLIMAENNNGAEELSAYIIKYAPQKYEGTNIYNFEDNVDKDLTTLFGRITNECDEVCTTLCWDCIAETEYAFPHPPGRDCILPSFIFTTCSTVCTDYQGGSLGGGTTWTGGSLNTGSGSNGTTEIVTAPVYGGSLSDGEEKTPCNTLKKKSNENEFKLKFNNLNTSSSFELNHESGYGDRTDSMGITTYTDLSCAPGGHSLYIPGSLHLTGFTHVHIDEYIDSLGVTIRPVKMFSPGDIRTFSESIQEGAAFNNLSHLDTYGIMLTSEGIFAIKMLTPIPATVNIDWDEIIKDYKGEIELLKEFDNLQTNDLKKMFLKLLKKHNLENNIGLFEGKIIPEISDTPIWNKLYLEGNKVKKTPC